MFGPVQPTRYDLAFSVIGIPVRVTPWFWLAGVLLGFDLLQVPDQGPILLLIWLGVVFVSILVHELGHATVAALCGYPPSIMLYQFGGMAFYQPTHGYSTAKAILITAAGPAFGFSLGIAAFVATVVIGPGNLTRLADFTLGQLIYVNIAWTILNVMPVLPLDGGNICREVCLAASPRRGIFVALWISIIVAGLIGAGLMFLRQTFSGLMFLMLAMQNYQELQQRRAW
jgi:Zn-dependent protease